MLPKVGSKHETLVSPRRPSIRPIGAALPVPPPPPSPPRRMRSDVAPAGSTGETGETLAFEDPPTLTIPQLDNGMRETLRIPEPKAVDVDADDQTRMHPVDAHLLAVSREGEEQKLVSEVDASPRTERDPAPRTDDALENDDLLEDDEHVVFTEEPRRSKERSGLNAPPPHTTLPIKQPAESAPRQHEKKPPPKFVQGVQPLRTSSQVEPFFPAAVGSDPSGAHRMTMSWTPDPSGPQRRMRPEPSGPHRRTMPMMPDASGPHRRTMPMMPDASGSHRLMPIDRSGPWGMPRGVPVHAPPPKAGKAAYFVIGTTFGICFAFFATGFGPSFLRREEPRPAATAPAAPAAVAAAQPEPTATVTATAMPTAPGPQALSPAATAAPTAPTAPAAHPAPTAPAAPAANTRASNTPPTSARRGNGSRPTPVSAGSDDLPRSPNRPPPASASAGNDNSSSIAGAGDLLSAGLK